MRLSGEGVATQPGDEGLRFPMPNGRNRSPLGLAPFALPRRGAQASAAP